MMADWISVKDKLPEFGKVVLAFGTKSATIGMFQGVSKRNDCWWWKGHTIKHVSYWMPLPEPPKESLVTTGETHDGEWHTSISKTLNPIVTHWMQMPEPPKEDADNGNH